MSVSRRAQSADWIPVSRRPNMSSPLFRSCWAAVTWCSRSLPYFRLISIMEGLAFGAGVGRRSGRTAM
eukprot:118782-Alexandrium_andersonii.AAC.1